MARKRSRFGITLLILLVLCFLYAGFVVYRYFDSRYVTEMAYDSTITLTYTQPALLIRDEHVIRSNTSGVVQYQIAVAGKFISTTPLAIVYESQRQVDEMNRRERLTEETSLLKKVQKGPATDADGDISTLSGTAAGALRQLTLRASKGQGGEVETIRSEFQRATALRKYITGEYTDFSARIRQLESQIPERPAGKVLKANDTGYFSRYVDGNESVLSSKTLPTLTAAQVEQWIKKDVVYQPDVFGKCVESYNWYLAVPMAEEDLNNFKERETLTVTFVGSSGQPVEAWVKEIRKEENKTHRGLLILQSDHLTPEAVGLRTATVQLKTATYRGVRYNKRAQRIQLVDDPSAPEPEPGQERKKKNAFGVFVVENSKVSFKQVDIIYSG